MKTHNLTQSRAQNDPINSQMHGYSSRDLQDKHCHSGCDFSFSSGSIFDFKYSLDAETCQEEKEID